MSGFKPQNNYSEGYGKRGRSQKRSIKKSSGAKRFKTEDTRIVKETIEDESSDEDVSNTSIDKEAEVTEDLEKKKQVYDALVTILKSEHKEPKMRDNLNETSKEEHLTDEDLDEDEKFETEEQEIENNLLSIKDDEEEGENNDDNAGESDDESDNKSDPFDSHFNQPTEQFTNKFADAFKNKQIKYRSIKYKINEYESSIYSEPRILEDEQTKVKSPVLKSSIHSYALKKRLKINNDLLDPAVNNLTTIQKELVDPMFQYKDILYEYGNYGKDEEEYRSLYCLHVLNHIYKTRDRILKNNSKVQDNPDAEFLDQGFTRPKVLIVAPTRDAGYSIVNEIIKKSGIDQIDKKSKFRDQFYEESLLPASKPKSFQAVFKGNSNDYFVLGIKFTRKAIKLYSNFYQSDIIVCSPLGLHMILENTDKKKRQDDFLSSIELMIIDQLHSMEFQNISHVTSIFEHINKIPKEQHDTDFSRIKMWYINDQAKLFRQTMIFTKYISPSANFFLNGKCQNWSGRWKNHKMITPNESSIGQLGLRVKQMFHRFDIIGGSIVDEPDYRFKYFTSVIVQSITKSTSYEDGMLIYITDYTDYVRVRNYLKEKTTILFGDINEYSDQKQVNSNRALFQQRRVKVLLYTERLHHFRRYEIKGVKNIVFYKAPTNPEFYNEVVRYIGKNAFTGNTDINISNVRTIYSKLDGLALERIMGTKRAAVLTHGQNETYEFK
ncbi:hypothetical protein TBLA_0B05970 [Henningerozyma blattae CBS 6284]|uniref:U3 small nucleolar RNA-associated protein 25 n=1 Tax=Henningerozyma blattae (strain ATCC 34711 / CBS 6284 / DSM 70876 / NBRC 10599 / NRRL Y-10934 / UCD 77-7) TaxID=1071380 RepID=I2GZ71_HENB6|nr:hypothetical protein TBLA_0B05970 [Tetrapisispora blattae CBS 6284]CCH59423.1 hypothetical protein TBLA_0B05970 [Tetrapisispora blattae CBS 6284]